MLYRQVSFHEILGQLFSGLLSGGAGTKLGGRVFTVSILLSNALAPRLYAYGFRVIEAGAKLTLVVHKQPKTNLELATTTAFSPLLPVVSPSPRLLRPSLGLPGALHLSPIPYTP